jgi:hypothetical protein
MSSPAPPPTRRSSASRTPHLRHPAPLARRQPGQQQDLRFNVDLSATSALGKMASATGNATTDSTNLVTALNNIFMHGQMPAQMQTDIVNHVATLTNIPERVRVATYLVITSSLYKIEH